MATSLDPYALPPIGIPGLDDPPSQDPRVLVGQKYALDRADEQAKRDAAKQQMDIQRQQAQQSAAEEKRKQADFDRAEQERQAPPPDMTGYQVTGRTQNAKGEWNTTYKPADPEEDEANVATFSKGIGDLTLDPKMLSGRDPAFRKRVISRVMQNDPNWTQQAWESQHEARKSFGPQGKNGQNITSANTFIQHLGEVADAVDALHNHTGGKWVNAIPNEISSNLLGNQAIGAFSTIADTAANEYAKVVAGGNAPNEAELKNARALLNPNLGPQQIRANIKMMANAMGGRVRTLQNEWDATVGKPREGNFLENPAREVLRNKLGVDPDIYDRRPGTGTPPAQPNAAPAPAAATQQPVRVNTPQEAMALPPGTEFITPDGRHKVR